MKNTLLTLLLAGAGSAVMAQDSTMQTTQNAQSGNMNTTTNNSTWSTTSAQPGTNSNTPNKPAVEGALASNSAYSAYGTATAIPSNIQFNFNRDYPTATGATWSQNAEYYRASYQVGGRTTHVFYDSRGNSWTLALPKTVGYVPEEVVDGAIARYGNSLYSLTPMRAGNGDVMYGITLIDNGASRMEYVGEDGSAITDVYRVDSVDATMGDMPANNTNTDWQRTQSTMDNSTTTDSSNMMMNNSGTQTQDSTMQYQAPVNNESGMPMPAPEQEYNADPSYGVLKDEEESL